MNETLVTIIGTVITDVTPRKTQDGIRVANFRVASNQRKFDKESQSWVDGDSLFVAVTCWRDLAKHVTSSLVKGDPVVVMGRLYTRRYELEGQKRSVTELDARTVGPDLSRCTVEVERRRREGGDAVDGTAGEPANGAAEATAKPKIGEADGATGDGDGGGDTPGGPGQGADSEPGGQASEAAEPRSLQVVGAGAR